MPDEWADIKDAKTAIKYDDIPDPYASSKPKEEVKSSKKLENVGRTQKSQTVVKKKTDDPFGDDFGFSKNKKQSAKKDDFDFDFDQPAKKSQPDAFDFDGFDASLQKPKEKAKESNDWSQGLVFDGSYQLQESKPKNNNLDDIFGSGMLAPKEEVIVSNNPFDGFSSKPKKENPFAASEDVFANNSAFPTTGFSNSNWGVGFSGQMGSGQAGFNSGFGTSQPPLYSKAPVQSSQKSDFTSLNPFSSPQTNTQKVEGRALPPGVNSSDLFS